MVVIGGGGTWWWWQLVVVMRWHGVIVLGGGGGEEKCFGSLIVDVTNSGLRNLLISFLGRRLHNWYIGHKISISNKAFVV